MESFGRDGRGGGVRNSKAVAPRRMGAHPIDEFCGLARAPPPPLQTPSVAGEVSGSPLGGFWFTSKAAAPRRMGDPVSADDLQSGQRLWPEAWGNGGGSGPVRTSKVWQEKSHRRFGNRIRCL